MATPIRKRRSNSRRDSRKRRNPKNEIKFKIIPEPDDQDRFFVIEKLLDKKIDERGAEQYLVRWQNYPPEYDSWEPRAELQINASDMIQEYNRIPQSDRQALELHCICKLPYRFDQGGMIQCYHCKTWYHFNCLGINMEEANSYSLWFCTQCKASDPQKKNMFKPTKSNAFYSIPDNGF